MLNANELRKGTTFLLDGEPYEVLEYQHYKPGRGNAIIRTKIRNMRTGVIIPRNFLDGHRFEEAAVERRTAQYIYNDGQFYYFMDSETYDQLSVSAERIGKRAGFLKDGMEITLTLFENEVCETGLRVQVPLFIEVGDVIRVDTERGEYLTRV